MKALVIGLGSMGKRRIRNLQALGFKDIYGFDQDQKTAQEAKKLYSIELLPDLKGVGVHKFDLGVISTPPAFHEEPARVFTQHKIPFFMELNLVTKQAAMIEKMAKKAKTPAFFSNTEFFDSDIAELQKMIGPKFKGYFMYHLGQNIGDWHPWQKPGVHFIFHPNTNGMREMLRTELPWLLKIFGKIESFTVVSDRLETTRYGVDDYMVVELRFKSGVRGTLVFDLLTPDVIKRMEVVSKDRRLVWNERENKIEVVHRGGKSLVKDLRGKQTLAQYKFHEDAHLEEIKHLLSALKGKTVSKLTFDSEQEVLKLIDAIEARIK